MFDDVGAVEKIVGGTLAGFVAAALYARRVMTGFAREGASESRAKAEMELIDNLRKELNRMAEQNDRLATGLNGLQLTVNDLNSEIGQLRVENINLTGEITSLRGKNGQLQEEISKLKVEIQKITTRNVLD